MILCIIYNTIYIPKKILNKILNFIASMFLGIKFNIQWFDSKIINIKNIHFGDNFISGKGLWLEVIDPGSIIFHANVGISDYVHIASANKIEINSGVLIGSKVLITDHSHGNPIEYGKINIIPNEMPIYSPGPIIIGKNTWIGDGVIVLGGVKIGRGCIIGANSVINRDIPDNCIASGSPVKLIQKL